MIIKMESENSIPALYPKGMMSLGVQFTLPTFILPRNREKHARVSLSCWVILIQPLRAAANQGQANLRALREEAN